MITIGSLFSGVGGLDISIEAAFEGYAKTLWQVEASPFCREVLAKHWPAPETKRFDDVRTVGVDTLEPVQVLLGGFPCKEVSWSNNAWGDPDKVGLEGDRSGLWREMYRVIREMEPGTVVIENVPALAARGLGTVIGDLMALGGAYRHIEWDSISARSVGARHRRDRIFIIAHNAPHPLRPRLERQQLSSRAAKTHATVSDPCWWEVESRVDRSVDGVRGGVLRNRARRIEALGNAVSPPVGYQVGLYLRKLLMGTTSQTSTQPWHSTPPYQPTHQQITEMSQSPTPPKRQKPRNHPDSEEHRGDYEDVAQQTDD